MHVLASLDTGGGRAPMRLRGRFRQGRIGHRAEFACIEAAVIVRPPVCGGNPKVTWPEHHAVAGALSRWPPPTR
jgi:hypothetical protein